MRKTFIATFGLLVIALTLVLVTGRAPTNSLGGAATSAGTSCFDTDDGQNLAVRGTVSGFQSGHTYSLSDKCVSSSSLTEYYCQKDASQSISSLCPAGTVCSSGACVTPRPA
jgi:hypothetical protein